MKKVSLYTDGACSGNPGNGGYAAILIYNGIEKEICGGEKDTTNNRMEIFAVIKGLESLKEACEVTIYSDSQYVVGAINDGWLDGWKANGWKTSSKSPVKNQDLWQRLCVLIEKHKTEFVKVKGHSDNEYNNRCDILAVKQYKNI